MKQTLLEIAQAHSTRPHGSYSSQQAAELEDLALAFFAGEISYTQVCKATGRSGSAIYGLLGTALRRGVVAGRLEIRAV